MTIPTELTSRTQWINWKPKEVDGKIKKQPIDPRTGRQIDATDPTGWCDYELAIAVSPRVGYVFTEEDGVVGTDIDNCIDNEGNLSPLAAKIVEVLDSYTEYSPRGRGLHVLSLGSLSGKGFNNQDLGVEMYDRRRYFAFTGRHVKGTPETLRPNPKGILAAYNKFNPPQLGVAPKGPVLGTKAENSALQTVEEAEHALMMLLENSQFQLLLKGDWKGIGYATQSSADLAFLSFAAPHVSSVVVLDKMLRDSGLYREKWERADYRKSTFAKIDTLGNSLGDRLKLRFTDLGNADVFAALHGGDVRYIVSHKEWRVWNGKVWATDDNGAVRRLGRRTLRVLVSRIFEKIDDPDKRSKALKHVAKTENQQGFNAMLNLAQDVLPIAARPSDFDKEDTEWLLNVLNGTLDLKTGVLREHRKGEMITKLAPVNWEADAKCPKWDAFLERITGGSAEITGYLRRAVGYALTANVGEHVIFFLYGEGANGKSTFLETLRAALGNYTLTMDPSTIAKRRGGEAGRARSDLVRLRGARLVSTIELEEGRHLAEALVKQMTGGDTMVARTLYKAEQEFMPSHKIFLATNHKPEITGTDWAIWRRIRLIPFEQVIPEEEQIKNYFSTVLRDELPGILRWAVEGCLEWQLHGLGVPEPVTKATEKYREEMDRIGQFIADECSVGPELKAYKGPLYEAYRVWCISGGMRPTSNRKFWKRMENRKFRTGKDDKGKFFWGLGFVPMITINS